MVRCTCDRRSVKSPVLSTIEKPVYNLIEKPVYNLSMNPNQAEARNKRSEIYKKNEFHEFQLKKLQMNTIVDSLKENPTEILTISNCFTTETRLKHDCYTVTVKERVHSHLERIGNNDDFRFYMILLLFIVEVYVLTWIGLYDPLIDLFK